jgi:hypothetical protein
MSFRKTVRPLLASLLLAVAGASAVACAAPTETEEASGEGADAISSSLRMARACAVRDAYLNASVSDFRFVSPEEAFVTVPPTVDAQTIVAVLHVPGAGGVVVVEHPATALGERDRWGDRHEELVGAVLGFYDANGRLITAAYANDGMQTVDFYLITPGSSWIRRDENNYDIQARAIESELTCATPEPTGERPELDAGDADAG